MFNHARTLLANLDNTVISPAADFPSVEPVSSNFHSLKLTPPFSEIHKVLFGSSPDTYYILYRTEQLMRIIHSTEYASYVTDLDPRVTYDLNKRNLFDINPVRVELIANGSAYSESTEIKILGNFFANDFTGRGEYKWELETKYQVLTSEIGLIYVPQYSIQEFKSQDKFNSVIPNLNRVGTRVEDVASYDSGAYMYSPGFHVIPAPNSNESFPEAMPGGADFKFKFIMRPGLDFIHNLITEEPTEISDASDIYDLTGVYPGNSRWLITVRCRPALDLSYILKAVQKYETTIIERVPNTEEPFKTFINLYQNHYALPYKLTGLLLLYIYALDKQRNGS